jgi:hypothetical protein
MRNDKHEIGDIIEILATTIAILFFLIFHAYSPSSFRLPRFVLFCYQ